MTVQRDRDRSGPGGPLKDSGYNPKGYRKLLNCFGERANVLKSTF